MLKRLLVPLCAISLTVGTMAPVLVQAATGRLAHPVMQNMSVAEKFHGTATPCESVPSASLPLAALSPFNAPQHVTVSVPCSREALTRTDAQHDFRPELPSSHRIRAP